MVDKKKLSFALAIALIMAVLFWTQSRLPQLNEKAQMGQRNNISAIAFNPLYSVDLAAPYLQRVAITAVNWGYTNWKGMTFGLAFAAAFLTIFRLLPRGRPSKNGIINSIKGLITGIPLGVCVNCTTPIAYGMHQAGINLQTVLATLMSSPTLNIVVLTMAFSLLPFHLAVIKVLSAILFILFFLPLMIKLARDLNWFDAVLTPSLEALEPAAPISAISLSSGNEALCEIPAVSRSWSGALRCVLRDYFGNLSFILRMTLPLMLLAGVMGAFLIELIDFKGLYQLETGLISLLLVSLVGTFLPVPIAFDIIIVTTLLALGLSSGLSMALLFSLAIFSVYPALIIAHKISSKLSVLIFCSTVIFAILTGFFSQFVDDRIKSADAKSISQGLKQAENRQMLGIAVKECNILQFDHLKRACIEKFLNSDMGYGIDRSLCNSLNELDGGLVQVCHSSIESRTVLAMALQENNIEKCLTLNTNNQQGKCWMAFAEKRALDTKAIEYCDTFKKGRAKHECQLKVLLFRTARMQNKDACNIKLSPTAQQDCLNHVASMKKSLGGDLSSCQSLPNKLLVHNCQKSMFILEIEDEHNYSFCDKITDDLLRQQCVNYSQFDRARINADSSFCALIDNKSFQQRCILSATEEKIKRVITDNGTGSFDTLSKSVGYKADPAMEDDYEIIPHAPEVKWTPFMQNDHFSIHYTEYKNVSSGSVIGFKKVNGDRLGVSNPVAFNLQHLFEPFTYGGGIATGDFNNDFWPDIVFSSDSGLRLYQNNGDGTFSLVRPFTLENESFHSVVVAFVDIDNDGWQDLFVSTYGGDNYFFINHEGHFDSKNKIALTDKNRILTKATAFADWNYDGYLDFVLGNWSYGTEGAFNPEYSHNLFVTNEELNFKKTREQGLEGDTLSVLLSDLNQDNNMDLVIANDREYPDHYYFGDESGAFISIDKSNLIPVTSLNNMSVDTADFNNDLLMDLFSSDMSFAIGINKSYCELLLTNEDVDNCKFLMDGYAAIQHYDFSWCNSQKSLEDQQDCLISLAIKIANEGNNSEYCQKIPRKFHVAKTFCLNLANKGYSKAERNKKSHIPQKQSNVLLIQTVEGEFKDLSESMGVSKSFWSWTGKAADLDNDEWQDIYIGNGYEFGTKNNEIHSNVFFHNQKGKNFIREEKKFGLEDYINTSSYSYSDIDLDGDLDIIATGVMSVPRFYINQGSINNGISFSLRDQKGNNFCIGCRVIIHYADTKKQIRELKLGGGFQSFDDPVIYFGLGKHAVIDKLEIIWSDGERSFFKGPFSAQRRYLIDRKAK